jgi:hypothetical protein
MSFDGPVIPRLHVFVASGIALNVSRSRLDFCVASCVDLDHAMVLGDSDTLS